MAKWKAWLIIGVLACIGGLLVWFGLVIVVRADRVEAGRVDVTVDRRLLGVLPLSREVLADVVRADVYVVRGRTAGRRGSASALELTSRGGVILRRTRFGPSVGADPFDAAEAITQFMKDPSRASMTSWWMPWLVNVAAIPFVLIVAGVVGEVLIRRLRG
jgi:hypothetical protein